ncbi:hypothetical protein [Streptomyces sp. NPDC003032]
MSSAVACSWRGSYEHTSFTFLGLTFRARGARNRKGVNSTGFLPGLRSERRRARS